MNQKEYKNKLSICIVSYNVKDYLEICLKSIIESLKDITYEIIVVDNSSIDDTVLTLQDKFKSVNFFPQNQNLGFAKANNIAIMKASGQYILLLNPDTKLIANSVLHMLDFMEKNPNIGIIGPKLLNDDNTIQNGLRRFPTLLNVLSRNTWLKHIPFLKKEINKYHMRDYNLSQSGYVNQVSGAAMLFRNKDIETIGYLDERFFIFFEEVDFCKRFIDAGYKVYYDTNSVIYHFGGKSREKINITAKIIHMESQFKYLKKHNSKIKYFLFIIIYKILFLFFIFIDFILDIIFLLLYRFIISLKIKFIHDKKIKSRIAKSKFRQYFIFNKLFDFIFKM